MRIIVEHLEGEFSHTYYVSAPPPSPSSSVTTQTTNNLNATNFKAFCLQFKIKYLKMSHFTNQYKNNLTELIGIL